MTHPEDAPRANDEVGPIDHCCRAHLVHDGGLLTDEHAAGFNALLLDFLRD